MTNPERPFKEWTCQELIAEVEWLKKLLSAADAEVVFLMGFIRERDETVAYAEWQIRMKEIGEKRETKD